MPYFGNEPSKQAIKIGDNTILSSNIADGVIINADIKSDAAIAMSKTALSAGTGITLSTNTLSVDAAQTQITSVGTIGTGVWNGTKVASAYLDDDTAHLSGSTFTGALISDYNGGRNLKITNTSDNEGIWIDNNSSSLTSALINLHGYNSSDMANFMFLHGYDSNASATKFKILGDGSATFAGAVTLQDQLTVKAEGASNDIVAQWQATNGNNCATFRTTDSGHVFKIMSQNSGTLEFDTSLATFSGNINLGDGDTIKLGDTAGDFELYHVGGSVNVIRGNGGLVLQSDDTSYGIQMGTYSGGETMFKAVKNGAVTLYYDNAVKFATTSAGIDVTGAITSGTHLIDGVSNYTGLEVKGSGGSRPQVKWTNVNNGNLGSVYATEGSALSFQTGTSLSTALTLDSEQAMHIQRRLSHNGLNVYVKDVDVASSSGSSFTILRSWHDTANWGLGMYLVEIFQYYYSADTHGYAAYHCTYGYSGGATVVEQIANTGDINAPTWTGETTISGNLKMRNLELSVGAYKYVKIRVTTPDTYTSNADNNNNNTVHIYP